MVLQRQAQDRFDIGLGVDPGHQEGAVRLGREGIDLAFDFFRIAQRRPDQLYRQLSRCRIDISRNRSTAADGKIRIREQSNRARKSRRLSLIVPPSRIGAPPATRRTGFPAVCPSMQKKV
jgi:hypothetical protein